MIGRRGRGGARYSGREQEEGGEEEEEDRRARPPIPQLPQTPTVQSQGVPDYLATGFISILGPANLPAEIVAKLNETSNAWLALDETRSILPSLGLTPLGGTPADLTRRMAAEVALWRPIIQAANISIE